MELSIKTNIIQVTNVAPEATLEQMKTLFGYLGKIDEVKLYPSETYFMHSSSKVCYVRFAEDWSVGVALHLSNTVFIDRALIVVPFVQDAIPDEMTAMALCFAPSGLSGSNSLINQVIGIGKSEMITTIDPRLTALGLPEYPPLPANTDPIQIEEIRRTLRVGNLDVSVTGEQLLKFFNHIGEVKYARMGGEESNGSKFALIEFTDQATIISVLQYNGVNLAGKPLRIEHSTCVIIKPQTKSSEAAKKEIEDAMKRVDDPQSSSPVSDSDKSKRSKRGRSRSRSRSKSHERSASRSRKKSRSRSHSERSRKHSKSKERSLSRKRSKSKQRSRSRSSRRKSRSRHRSKSAEKKFRKMSRSNSSSFSERSRSVSKRSLKSKHGSRSHSRERMNKVKGRHRSSSRKRDKSKDRDSYKSRNRDRSKSRNRVRSRSRKRDRSRSRNRVRSRSRNRDRTRSRNKDKHRSSSRSGYRSRSRDRYHKSRSKKRSHSPVRSHSPRKTARSPTHNSRSYKEKQSSPSRGKSKSPVAKHSRSSAPRKSRSPVQLSSESLRHEPKSQSMNSRSPFASKIKSPYSASYKPIPRSGSRSPPKTNPVTVEKLPQISCTAPPEYAVSQNQPQLGKSNMPEINSSTSYGYKLNLHTLGDERNGYEEAGTMYCATSKKLEETQMLQDYTHERCAFGSVWGQKVGHSVTSSESRTVNDGENSNGSDHNVNDMDLDSD